MIIACALGGGCVQDALLAVTPGVDDFPGSPTVVPRDSPLGHEIQEGYRTYGVTLAPLGQWSTDPVYGVRWCPSPTNRGPFIPFVSNGHWASVEPPRNADAPPAPDTPFWVADATVAGGDVTMHHGWWVSEGPSGRWCWIPGVAETPARVLWREGEGFVGWAAEPPPTVDDDGDDDDLLSWVYELTGTLFEEAVEDFVLTGDAADAADYVTSRARSHHRPARIGPPQSTVKAARGALSEYVAAHPTVSSKGQPSAPSNPGVRSSIAGPRPLPRGYVLYKQLALEGPPPTRTGTQAALPAVPARGISSAGHGSAFNSYAGHAGAGRGCNCASQSGGHSESHSSGHSSAGHVGSSSGGDCGSHSTHHK